MKRIIILFFLLAGLAIPSVGICQNAKKTFQEMERTRAKETIPERFVKAKSVYDFVVKDMNGKDLKLSSYRGKVLMIVNMPSGCGCGQKPTIRSLQTLYKKYKDRGFVLLGLPADKPGEQTDSTNPEIKELIETNHVTFPLTMKIPIYGADMHPLYRFLTDKKANRPFGGEITDHFNQFIFDRSGKIVGRFEVGDLGVEPTIDNALGDKPEETPRQRMKK